MRHLKTPGPTFCTLPSFWILDPHRSLTPYGVHVQLKNFGLQFVLCFQFEPTPSPQSSTGLSRMSICHLQSFGFPFVFYFHLGSLGGFTLPHVLSMHHLKSLGPVFCILPPCRVLDPQEVLLSMMSMRPLNSVGYVLHSASILKPREAVQLLSSMMSMRHLTSLGPAFCTPPPISDFGSQGGPISYDVHAPPKKCWTPFCILLPCRISGRLYFTHMCCPCAT